MSEAPIVARKRFTAADQEAFARLSGDRNPIHMDELSARRTQAGAAVVHGVQGLLWALDQVGRTECLSGLRAVSVKFLRYLYLDVEADVRWTRRDDAMIVEIIVDGQTITTAKLEWGDPGPAALAEALTGAPSHGFGETPQAPSFEAMGGLRGYLGEVRDDQAHTLFPALSGAIGATSVAAIALVSGVVGMSCPGLYSLFSQLNLRRVESRAAGLAWRAVKTEPRTRWVGLEVSGEGWEGQVVTFARPEPVQALSLSDLSYLVDPHEFKDRFALVIGGSRGLGAVTGKLLAAGGARVILTYARGAADAEAVCDEINAFRGDGACATAHCDVAGEVATQLAQLPSGISHLYYFATPQIARQRSRMYDRDILNNFLAIYIDGFSAVWDALAAMRPLAILYPSTVFIEDRPRGMTEYAMVKSAAEALCADFAQRESGVSMMTPRIPRTLTDQTATTPPVPAADPVEVMLPLLRSQGLG